MSLVDGDKDITSNIIEPKRSSNPLIMNTKSIEATYFNYYPSIVNNYKTHKLISCYIDTTDQPNIIVGDFSFKSANLGLSSLLQSYNNFTSQTRVSIQKKIYEIYSIYNKIISHEDNKKKSHKQTYQYHKPISRLINTRNSILSNKHSSYRKELASKATLVDELDRFVSKPFALSTIHKYSQPLKMFPHSLPPLSDSYTQIQRLAELVKRRSYLNVIEYSSNLLLESGNTDQTCNPYSRYYKELVRGITNNFKVNKRIQSETCRVIRWRLLAFSRLALHNELLDEIQKINLFTENSHDNEYSSKIKIKSIPLWVDPQLIFDAVLLLQKHFSLLYSASTSLDCRNSTIKNSRLCTDVLYNLRHDWPFDTHIGKQWMLLLDISLSNVHYFNNEWRISLQRLDIAYNELKDYITAVLHRLCDENDNEIISCFNRVNMIELFQRACGIDIFSRQGRILLQSGIINGAQKIFDRAILEYSKLGKTLLIKNLGVDINIVENKNNISFNSGINIKTPTHEFLNAEVVINALPQISINAGLLYFSHREYDLAIVKFREAVELYSSHKNSSSLYNEKRAMINDVLADGPQFYHPDRLVSCWNNIALGLAYQGQIVESISVLESVIKLDPTTFLTHSTTFNLCTLYELSNNNRTSDEKKNILKLLADRFCLHDLPSESFRVL